MIVLTQEQVTALQSEEPTRMHVVNPQTSERFVLVPLTQASLSDYDDGSWTDEERDLLRLEACRLLDSWGKDT
jgi:hypothetical protein